MVVHAKPSANLSSPPDTEDSPNPALIKSLTHDIIRNGELFFFYAVKLRVVCYTVKDDGKSRADKRCHLLSVTDDEL